MVNRFFYRILKQVESYVVKLPIVFPFSITGVLMKQKYDILIVEYVVDVSPSPLNFSYRLFFGNHVIYIVLPNLPDFGSVDSTICGNLTVVPPMSGATNGHVLNELILVFRTWLSLSLLVKISLMISLG